MLSEKKQKKIIGKIQSFLVLGVSGRLESLRQGSAQATIEFTFAMIIAVLLLIGMIQVTVWVGGDLSARRKAHEDFLTQDIEGWKQTNPTFYRSAPIFAAVGSDLYGNAAF